MLSNKMSLTAQPQSNVPSTDA